MYLNNLKYVSLVIRVITTELLTKLDVSLAPMREQKNSDSPELLLCLWSPMCSEAGGGG